MKKNGTRPQRIAPEQVDAAVNEALQRVKQAEELSVDDLSKVSGGLAALSPTGIDTGTTTGFLPPDSTYSIG